MRRQPAVAGQFYPGNAKGLRNELEKLVKFSEPKRKVTGVISPHAGYMYSGAVAGRLYGALEIPPDVIVLGPNHRGIGYPAALYPEGDWVTPIGDVPVNSSLSLLVKKHAPSVAEDTVAHQYEHSLEVQIPFLKYLRPDVTIVPICLGIGDFATCRAIGEGIAQAITDYGRPVLVVASSDMTHYESAESARRKDTLALNQVLALNPQRLLEICRSQSITMCGVVPSVVMLVAAKALGAAKAEIVHYATSGDVTGDNRQVVAYAAVTISA